MTREQQLNRSNEEKFRALYDGLLLSQGVAAEWRRPRGFLQFLDDVGLPPPGRMLKRPDETKPWGPTNCIWTKR